MKRFLGTMSICKTKLVQDFYREKLLPREDGVCKEELLWPEMKFTWFCRQDQWEIRRYLRYKAKYEKWGTWEGRELPVPDERLPKQWTKPKTRFLYDPVGMQLVWTPTDASAWEPQLSVPPLLRGDENAWLRRRAATLGWIRSVHDAQTNPQPWRLPFKPSAVIQKDSWLD